MMNAVAWFWMMALLLAAGAMLLLHRAQQQAASERVMSRLHDETLLRAERRRGTGLRRLLLQAGLNLPVSVLVALAAVGVLLIMAVLITAGPFTALCVLLILAGGLHFLLRWRYKQRVSRMVGQLPAFLDHVIRSLKSGRTLGDALQLAITRCPDPLRVALSGSLRSLELGLPIGEVMSDFAELYDRQELHMLAVSVKVNQRYGGNASDLMDSLILLIRDRERASGQLRAMTGETRIGAWVLGVLPLLLGGYVFASNPDMFLNLWDDPTGRLMLFGALGLQAIGSWLLWRMLRSV
jgi:tight adherence protein B